MPDSDPPEDLTLTRPPSITPRADVTGGDQLPESAEAVLLHIRVIALENLMIAVLAAGSDHQRQLARDMAQTILPHAGATPHPLTIRASRHMTDLVDRAMQVCAAQP